MNLLCEDLRMAINHSLIKKILIINLAFIGDVLLSTSLVRALRNKYPTAKIDMMVIPLTEAIAKGNPYVDNVIVYDKKGKHKKLSELWNLIKFVQRQQYDLSVSANFAPRGSMIALVAGIKNRVGYDAQHGGIFVNYVAKSDRPVIRHESENYLDILTPLGISCDDTSLAFTISTDDIQSMKCKTNLDQTKKNIIICPFGSYQQKSWTVNGYAYVIERLAEQADCYLVGSKGEQSKLEEINTAASQRAKVLAGTLTLGELAALIAHSSAMLTVDTGPMHLANAVGTPIVALFGPTDPITWGPRGDRDIVLVADAPCAPCWGKKECPQTRCMEQLKADNVLQAIMNLLGK